VYGVRLGYGLTLAGTSPVLPSSTSRFNLRTSISLYGPRWSPLLARSEAVVFVTVSIAAGAIVYSEEAFEGAWWTLAQIPARQASLYTWP
jgi:hypothetical protein